MKPEEIITELKALISQSQSLVEPISALIQGTLPIPSDYNHRADCTGVEMKVKCLGCFKGWIAEQKKEKAELIAQLENLKANHAAYLTLLSVTQELTELPQMAVDQIHSKDEFEQFNLFSRRLQDKIDVAKSMYATNLVGETSHQNLDPDARSEEKQTSQTETQKSLKEQPQTDEFSNS